MDEFIKYFCARFCVYGTISKLKVNCKITNNNEILKIKLINEIFFIPFIQNTKISLLSW